jgi:hypothetical protein
MKITINGDDLKLNEVAWDHILTEHGLESAASLNGWTRKSQWYGNEEEIKDAVCGAFGAFRDHFAGQDFDLIQDDYNLKSVVDIKLKRNIGTGVDGKATPWVRLVLIAKRSGECKLITAFPL